MESERCFYMNISLWEIAVKQKLENVMGCKNSSQYFIRET